MNPLTTTSLLFLSSLIAFADVEFDSTKLRAEKGDIEAQIDLARMYESGEGAPKDTAKAAEWTANAIQLLRKAAEKGDVEAHKRLGDVYFYGIGVPKDRSKGVGLHI